MTRKKESVLEHHGDMLQFATDEEKAAMNAWPELRGLMDALQEKTQRLDPVLAKSREQIKPLLEQHIGLCEQKLHQLQVLVAILPLLERCLQQTKEFHERLLEETKEP